MLAPLQAAYILAIRSYAECWTQFAGRGPSDFRSWLKLHDFVQAQVFVAWKAFLVRPTIPEAIQNAMEFRRSMAGHASLRLQLDVERVLFFTTWSPRHSFFIGKPLVYSGPQPEPLPAEIGPAEEVLSDIRLVTSRDLQVMLKSIDDMRKRVDGQAREVQGVVQRLKASNMQPGDEGSKDKCGRPDRDIGTAAFPSLFLPSQSWLLASSWKSELSGVRKIDSSKLRCA
ncbi:hypothetical protein BDN72DRAFT_863529 [Pluteus cervinus]|uniref:Uncharacterized protein n=1 Tax=Pluteus cervinus TaxID=181527 RepID=A0ACD3A7A5_9AGAR|nr:hypothetical protein BDN72DRAFT_863529 [Pluteus cervinus]